MKQLLAFFLAVLMLLGMLTGCQSEKVPEQTEPTQSAQEQEVLRILTIGNSHTVDTNLLLYYVFQTEKPGQKLMLGNMYHSGCAVSQHVSHFKLQLPAYTYYKNTGEGWKQTPQVSLETALKDQVWDIVILHEMNTGAGIEQTYRKDHYQELLDYVNQTTEYPPKIIWNFSWANPTSQELWDLGFPGNWTGSYRELYNTDYVNMLTQMAHYTQKYVMVKKEFSGMIPTGTAFCYARNELGQSDEVLYRDYTHISDYGSLLAGYLWYATITGKTEITEVNVDVIPSGMRCAQTIGKRDIEVTQEMKDVIVKSVNFALKNPWEVAPVKE